MVSPNIQGKRGDTQGLGEGVKAHNSPLQINYNIFFMAYFQRINDHHPQEVGKAFQDTI